MSRGHHNSPREAPSCLREKTIPVVSEKDADCRAEVGGRGPRVYKYEAWGVRYEVATDEHGIFNGSDEYAAKAAGCDLGVPRRCLQYDSCPSDEAVGTFFC